MAGFTNRSNKRIASVVRKVERRPDSLVGDAARKGLPPDKWCYARITSGAGDGGSETVKHAWIEQRYNFAAQDWEPIPDDDGRSGTEEENYVISAPDPSRALVIDGVYLIRRVNDYDPDSEKTLWVAVDSVHIPAAQYQGMGWYAVAANVMAMDYNRCFTLPDAAT